MKQLITLKPFHHRSGEQIGIYFQNNLPLTILLRSKAGAKWRQSGKCWYVPMDRQSYEKIKVSLPADVKLETQDLKKYLENKKQLSKKTTAVIRTTQDTIQTRPSRLSSSISPANKHILPAMRQMLKLKAFSPSAIRTYINEMSQLLSTIKDIPADELKPEHLKRYLVYCYEKLGLKENTLQSRINAMKFYYEQVLKREKFFWEIPRPKKQLILPKVLGEDELARLFNALGNLKHKAMLFTALNIFEKAKKNS